MHVAGGADRLPELLAEPHDLPVDLPEILLHMHAAPRLPEEIVVVARGLDLQIIVVIHDPGDLRVALSGKDRRIELPCRAGRAQDQAVAVLVEQALRYPRAQLEIVQMRLRDQGVEISAPGLIFREKDRVIILAVPDAVRRDRTGAVEIRKGLDSLPIHQIQQLQIHQRHALRARKRPHGVLAGYLQMLRQPVKADPPDIRHQVPGHGRDVHPGPALPGNAELLRGRHQEVDLLVAVVGHQRQILREREKVLDHVQKVRGGSHHIVGDPGLRLDGEGDRPHRLH